MFLGLAQAATADVQLLPITGVWRYNQTDNLDETVWWTIDFDDSSWPAGPGLLYVELNPAVSPRFTPLTLGRTTYYFRRHFAVPFPPTNFVMTFSARIDDGAVFYLNGREIQRVRMPAAPAVIRYTNFATATPPSGDAITSDVFTLSDDALTNLVQGDNLLAAEVHQDTAASDDIVFGTSVTVRFVNSPPVFISQPTSLTVLDGRPATLSVVVDGNPTPAKQWFKDGAPIPGATGQFLGFPNVNPTNAGTYWLVATNVFGTRTSSNAVLTVLADTNPPFVVSALATRNLTNILVSFSETVASSSATALSNYLFYQTSFPTNILTIQSATLQNGSNVILTTSPRVGGVNYSLFISGVTDVSSAGNAIASNSLAPLAYETDLFDFDAATSWRFYQSSQPPPTNWLASSYEDSAWPQGAPLFSAGATAPATTEPVRTSLALSNNALRIITHYFRTVFSPPGPLQAGSVRLRAVVDDGAAFYLNGSEVFSIGLPAARPLTYSTFSSRTIGTATYEPALASPGFSLSTTNFDPVENLFAAEVHQPFSGVADVAFGARLEAVVNGFAPRPTLVLPAMLLEGAGTLTNQGMVFLQDVFPTNVIIPLSTGGAADLVLPASVTILAGATNARFDITVRDDALINGPRAIAARAGPAGIPPTTVTVLDNEINYLLLELPPLLTEGQSNVVGRVRFAQPAVRDVSVALTSSDTNAVIVPSSILVPAGATSAVFNLTVVEDRLIDGPQSAVVTALVLGWPPASMNVVVNDNESLALAVSGPLFLIEGGGGVVSTGKVSLAGIAVSEVVVGLTANPASQVTLPANVTILAGQSNVTFVLSANEDDTPEGTRNAVITASSPGFIQGSATISIVDNDVHHFRFSEIGSPQRASVAFGVTIRAEDPSGALVTNFSQTIPLAAVGLHGSLTVDPTSVPLSLGQWSGAIRVTNPDRLVRLSSALAPGESNPFTVEQPVVHTLTQWVGDIAWHEASGTLFATVPPNGGAFSNRIVAIDPFSGTITNSYPLGGDPSQMEMSGDGTYLYVALSNRNALCRFDLMARRAGIPFGTGNGPVGARRIRDLAIIGGTEDSVVITSADAAGNSAGTWRYNSGVAVNLDTFSALDPYLIEASPLNQTIYGYQNNNAFRLMRGLALPASALVFQYGVISGSSIIYRDGVLYDDTGRAVVADTFAVLGDYPNVLEHLGDSARVEVDAVLKRTIFLAGQSGLYQLKAYDRDSFLPLGEFGLPPLSSEPGRLLNCGTNGLAFQTGTEIWLVREPTIQPTQPPADLVLTQTATPLPALLGSNLVFTLTVSNRGPNLATLLNLSNALPVNATVVNVTPSTGTVTQAAGAISWNVARLDAGASATLQLVLRPTATAWIANQAFVTGYEPDPNLADNASRIELYVQLSPTAYGAFELRYSAEDMIYDPARDRLLLSVANGSGGQSSGIGVLNPYTGIVEEFFPLSTAPGKLLRSLDGQFLYVSLKQFGLIRRLTLTNLHQNLDIRIGSEVIEGTTYPYFAGDFEVLPGSPRSIAVWQVRQAGPLALEYGRGIAIFDDGVVRSNSVAMSGGSFTLEFDTDQRTLYAFQGLLSRYTIDASGIALAATYPPLDHTFGGDMEYAAGRLFNNSGRALRTEPFGVVGTYSGSESAALVEPDAASGQVFYLVGTGSLWQLNTYGMSTFDVHGSLAITNVSGTPGSLIRWGTNGLAFRTTSNQVFIIRSPVVDARERADLTVEIDVPDAPVPPGSTAFFTVTVTNQGPAPARDVRLTSSISPGAELVGFATTDGQSSANGGTVLWALPELAAGAEEALSVVVRLTPAGTYTVSADLLAATEDIERQNNSARAVIVAGDSLGPESVSSLALPVNDVVWSPARGQLLVTVNSNQPNWGGVLASVNPLTLAVAAERQLGPNAGRLAVSDDGRRLYAALDFDMSEMDLPTLTSRVRFPLDALGRLLRIGDFEVLRDAPDSVVVGRLDPYSAGLAVFDGGVIRSNTAALGSVGFAMERDALASRLYVQDFFAGNFRRFSIEAGGISLLDVNSTLLPQFTAMDLKWADGLIFTSIGTVIDPRTLTRVGLVAGITNHSPLCYDSPAQRVFYVSSSGTNAFVHAVDATTLIGVGTKSIGGIVGTPARLIRWGADGLAFPTSGGEIYLLRTGLIPSAPSADLSLSLTALAPTAYVGSNFVYSLAVTNAGPNPATNSQVLIRLSSNASSVMASPSQGTVAVSNQQVVVTLGTLAVGGVATLALSLIPAQPGDLTVLAKAISNSADPALANNTRSGTNPVAQLMVPDSVVILSRPAVDLAYNPASGRLYASSGSQISVINPALAQNEMSWSLPGAAGRLALSEDARFLYAVLDDGYRLGRLSVSNGLPDFVFAPDDGSFGSLITISDVAPIPGRSDAYVLSGGLAIHVYDAMVRRPVIMVDSAGAAFLEFGGFSNVVYGSVGGRLRTLTIDETGIGETAWNNFAPPPLGDFKYDGGALYTPGGVAIEPTRGLILGQIRDLGTESVVAPDLANQRLFFVTQIGATWQLRAYDPVSFGFIGSTVVSNVLGRPTRLVRWGPDGLAFCTTSNQLFIVRTSLLPSADVSITETNSPPPHLAGQSLAYHFVVKNAGPWTATNVILTNVLADFAQFDSMAPSQGTCARSGRVVVCDLGILASNAIATVVLFVTPTNSDNLVLTNSATVVSGLADSALENNTLISRLSVLADNDRDHLPDDWETANGLNPSNPLDALMDLDGDGLSNLQEYLAGTDPRDGTSFLRLLGIRIQGGAVQISFTSSSNRSYVVEESPTVPATSWTVAASGIAGSGGPLTVTLTNAPLAANRFYRVRTPP